MLLGLTTAGPCPPHARLQLQSDAPNLPPAPGSPKRAFAAPKRALWPLPGPSSPAPGEAECSSQRRPQPVPTASAWTWGWEGGRKDKPKPTQDRTWHSAPGEHKPARRSVDLRSESLIQI